MEVLAALLLRGPRRANQVQWLYIWAIKRMLRKQAQGKTP